MQCREPTPEELELYALAAGARPRAYVPYSKFAVGAALRTAEGLTVLGVNVENASYGMTVCAERVAAVRAVADGSRAFETIAVACPDHAVTATPCGACRQVLSEFGPEMTVVLRVDGNVVATTLPELLPGAFRLRE